MGELTFLDEAAVRVACPPAAAVAALLAALADGLDPGRDPHRQAVGLDAGQLMLMPSEKGGAAPCAGIKIVTIADAPGTPESPRIKGLYLMFDGRTLAPIALIDGPALTTLRTPAVSVAAVAARLRVDREPLDVVAFGAGPQASGHLDCLADTLRGTRELGTVSYVVRDPARVDRSTLVGTDPVVLTAGSPEAAAAVGRAGVVICATTARTPVLWSDQVRDDVVVLVVGSHEPDAREVDGALLGRSAVVVEHIDTAKREAGDVIMALEEGQIAEAELIELSEVAWGRSLPTDRPVVFKSVGMSWEDLVVAEAILAGAGGRSGVGPVASSH